jgi:hypothetical protein
MGVGGQRNAPAPLPPGKTHYLLYTRLGGPQGQSRKIKKGEREKKAKEQVQKG